MPDFYNKMKDKLRTVEQGADTIVWLALAKSAVQDGFRGQFFQVTVHCFALLLFFLFSAPGDQDAVWGQC
jgi:dehydrogenase/reductase SDR family protein 12